MRRGRGHRAPDGGGAEPGPDPVGLGGEAHCGRRAQVRRPREGVGQDIERAPGADHGADDRRDQQGPPQQRAEADPVPGVDPSPQDEQWREQRHEVLPLDRRRRQRRDQAGQGQDLDEPLIGGDSVAGAPALDRQHHRLQEDAQRGSDGEMEDTLRKPCFQAEPAPQADVPVPARGRRGGEGVDAVDERLGRRRQGQDAGQQAEAGCRAESQHRRQGGAARQDAPQEVEARRPQRQHEGDLGARRQRQAETGGRPQPGRAARIADGRDPGQHRAALQQGRQGVVAGDRDAELKDVTGGQQSRGLGGARAIHAEPPLGREDRAQQASPHQGVQQAQGDETIPLEQRHDRGAHVELERSLQIGEVRIGPRGGRERLGPDVLALVVVHRHGQGQGGQRQGDDAPDQRRPPRAALDRHAQRRSGVDRDRGFRGDEDGHGRRRCGDGRVLGHGGNKRALSWPNVAPGK